MRVGPALVGAALLTTFVVASSLGGNFGFPAPSSLVGAVASHAHSMGDTPSALGIQSNHPAVSSNYTVRFRAVGLPSGSLWYVSAGSPSRLQHDTTSGRSGTISFSEPAGPLSFAIDGPVQYGVALVSGSGRPTQTSVNVTGPLALTVHFGLLEKLYFNESIVPNWPGLRTGAPWGVSITPVRPGGPEAQSVNSGETAVIPVQSDPYALAFDPANGDVYVANTNSGNVSVIDGASEAVVATLRVGNMPVALAVDPVSDHVYVANEGSNSVSVISGSSNTVVANVTVGTGPYALTVASVAGSVYVANSGSGTVSVISVSTNAVDSSIAVGGAPYAMALDTTSQEVFVSNHGSDSVNAISVSTNSVVATIPMGGTGPGSIAFDPANGYVYLCNGFVNVINGSNNTQVTTVSVGSAPNAFAIDSTNGEVYVANTNSNDVSVIDRTTSAVTATIPVGSQPSQYGTPSAMAFDAANGDVYVTNSGSANVSVINTATNAVTATAGVGSAPYAAVVDPLTGAIYVANSGSRSVSVLPGQLWSTTLSFTVPAGAHYRFSITAPSVYRARPSHGTVGIPSHSLTKLVKFQFLTAKLLFLRTSLPRGTVWSVTVAGTDTVGDHWSVTLSGKGTSFLFRLPTGSYTYSVGTVVGHTPSPSAGTVSVVYPTKQSFTITWT